MNWLRRIVFLGLIALGWDGCVGADKIPQNQPVRISDDLQIVRLTDNCYLYTAWSDIEGWGRVGSNGMIVIDDDRAFMMDTPTTEAQTRQLAGWLEDNLHTHIESFAPGHWHADCVGGMGWLNRNGVNTYASQQTNRILASRGGEQARESFADSMSLSVGDTRIELYYLGGAHATDNIVGWVPSEKVLFGGCMIKDTTSASIGNTSDAAPLDQWLSTVERIEHKFSDLKVLIPGHGTVGGTELFGHTKQVVQNEWQRRADRPE